MQLVDRLTNTQLPTHNKVTGTAAHKSCNGRMFHDKLFEKESKNCTTIHDGEKSEDHQVDSEQQHIFISPTDLMDFRTRQCQDYQRGICKDSMKCWNSHSETWPRRSPLTHNYDYKLCSNINFIKSLDKMQLQGKCKYGRKCRYSHSKEEQLYHPLLYKTRLCINYPNCKSYYCPFAHGTEELRHTKQSINNNNNTGSSSNRFNDDGVTTIGLSVDYSPDGPCNGKLKVPFQAYTPSTASAITSPPNSPKQILLPSINNPPKPGVIKPNLNSNNDGLDLSIKNNNFNHLTLDILDKRLDLAFEALKLDQHNKLSQFNKFRLQNKSNQHTTYSFDKYNVSNNKLDDSDDKYACLDNRGDEALNIGLKSDISLSQWLVSTTVAPETDHLLNNDESNFYETIRDGREMYSTWGPYSDNYFHSNEPSPKKSPKGGVNCVGSCLGCECNDKTGYLDETMDDQWLNGVVQTGLDMATAEANRFLTTRVVNPPERSDFEEFYEPSYNRTHFSRFKKLYNDGLNASTLSTFGVVDEVGVIRKNASIQTVEYPPGFFD